jgi:hypothetical protein
MPADVIGTFAEPGQAAAAIRVLRRSGFTVRAAMPAPYPEVVLALGRPASAMNLVTLPMALVGLCAGAALVAGTALDWPLVTGDQPIVPFPPLVIIGFEVAVLFGALATLGSLAAGIRRGSGAEAFPAGERFDGDRIGVAASGGDPGEAERLLRSGGAEEVRHAE